MKDINSNLSLACNLMDQDFIERKALLKKEIFNSIERVEELANGFLFQFKEKEGFDAKLLELMASERTCCPFFEMKLHLLPYKKGITLEIFGEEGTKEFLKKELLD